MGTSLVATDPRHGSDAVRLLPRRWSPETWICSMRGHVIPAATAGELRDDGSDDAWGFDVGDGSRYSRCPGCDLWERRPTPSPGTADYPTVPPLDDLELPRRGRPLREAIVVRLIALERGLHCVLFTLLAVALLIVKLRLPAIESW